MNIMQKQRARAIRMAINRVSSSRYQQTARKQAGSAFVMAPLRKLLANWSELRLRVYARWTNSAKDDEFLWDPPATLLASRYFTGNSSSSGQSARCSTVEKNSAASLATVGQVFGEIGRRRSDVTRWVTFVPAEKLRMNKLWTG
ncbi:hypothetical protein K0M31_000426 [Melipona bicolor]|uniref:Uncharacterized protein n=1 Tax=Melipona bicolor TaxID=60889 RepID=A0AA40GDQ8_9HYME|nr:hypothetical protein K0M31_000426 [Melipona bicolor]